LLESAEKAHASTSLACSEPPPPSAEDELMEADRKGVLLSFLALLLSIPALIGA